MRLSYRGRTAVALKVADLIALLMRCRLACLLQRERLYEAVPFSPGAALDPAICWAGNERQ